MPKFLVTQYTPIVTVYHDPATGTVEKMEVEWCSSVVEDHQAAAPYVQGLEADGTWTEPDVPALHAEALTVCFDEYIASHKVTLPVGAIGWCKAKPAKRKDK